MKKLMVALIVFAISVGLALPAGAVDIPSEVTLIKNVNIFDGKSDELLMGYNVLVVKNLNKNIDKDIKIAATYEIDVNTGGYKAVASGGHICLDGLQHAQSAVTVYEPKKMIKKEVKVYDVYAVRWRSRSSTTDQGHSQIWGYTDQDLHRWRGVFCI